jgi:nucleoside triphosphate pyrophosphatase
VRLVLASASPRRAALLRAAAFEFEMRVVEIDERVRKDERAAGYVSRLAAEKSAAAMEQLNRENLERNDRLEEIVVIAADTAVVVGDEILGKPRDDEHAGAMLRLLSARRHEVMTGVSVRKGRTERNRVETTGVHCAALSDRDVAWYVASWEGRDKAGGYAIQGLASRFISRIDGSYSNVVGLPLGCMCDLLRLVLVEG